MSKATFFKIGQGLGFEDLRAFLMNYGFNFHQETPEIFTFDAQSFLDITQNMDDSGNGLCDADRYSRLASGIEKQFRRKLKSGWSDQKAGAWKAQMISNKLSGMLKGAENWKAIITDAFEEFKVSEIALLVMLNNQSMGLVLPVEKKALSIATISPLELVMLEMNVIYIFER